MARFPPAHPGEVLKHDSTDPLDLTATGLVKAVGVSPARINGIIPGRREITEEAALRLSLYFRTDARIRYRLPCAEFRSGSFVQQPADTPGSSFN